MMIVRALHFWYPIMIFMHVILSCCFVLQRVQCMHSRAQAHLQAHLCPGNVVSLINSIFIDLLTVFYVTGFSIWYIYIYIYGIQ